MLVKRSYQHIDTLFPSDIAALHQRITTLEQELAIYKQTSAALRLQEQALANVAIGIIIADASLPDLPIIYCNPAFEHITGYTAQETIGYNCRFLQGPQTSQQALASIRQALQTGQACHLTLRNYRKDGTLFWNDLSITPLYDEQGQLTHFIGSIADITNRIETEHALQESKRFVQRVTDTLPDMLYVYDVVEQRNVYINQAITSVLGYMPEEIPSLGLALVTTLVHPEDLSRVQQQRQQCLQTTNGEVIVNECRVRHASGMWCWLVVRETVFARHTDGSPQQILGMAQDITETKHALEALAEREQTIRCFFEQSIDGIVLMNEHGSVIEWNRGAEHIWGLQWDDVFGLSLWDALFKVEPAEYRTPAGYDSFTSMIRERLTFQHSPMHTRWISRTTQHVDGTIRFVDLLVFPIQTYKGLLFGVIIHDMTGYKQAEAALRESEARYRLLVQNLPDTAVIIFDQEMRCILAEGPALLEAGYDRASIEGKTMAEVIPAESIARLESIGHATLEGYDQQFERHIGQSTFLVHTLPLRDSQEHIVSGMVVIRDITEQKHMEHALAISRASFQSVVDQSHEGIMVLSAHGDVRYMNPRMRKLLGDHAMLPNKPLEPPAISRNRTEISIERKDGQRSIAEMTVVEAEWDQEPSFVVLLYDITERKQVEWQLQQANEQLVYGMDRLRQRNHEAMMLARMGDLLQSCISVDDIYEVVATMADVLFVGHTGALYIRCSESAMFCAVADWGNMPPDELTLTLDRCQALQSGQTHLAHEQHAGPWCGHIDRPGMGLSMCVPLLAQRELLGVLHLRHIALENQETFSHWQQLVEMIARHVAMALNNTRLRECLQEQATHDPLTGLFNRRYLDEMLHHEFQRAASHRQPVGIIMLDIDHFKRFNDTYGHDAGDRLLTAVAAFLKSNTREGDIACRYGGEEFIVVLPGATFENTIQRAGQMREGVKALHIEHSGQPQEAITISLGVAMFPDHGTTSDSLLKAADIALYQAKAEGRDRVMVAYVRAT